MAVTDPIRGFTPQLEALPDTAGNGHVSPTEDAVHLGGFAATAAGRWGRRRRSADADRGGGHGFVQPTSDAAPRLRGRRREYEVLDGLLEAIGAGHSQVLVLRGEPGIGKSSLLEYLVERASWCRVTRTTSVESDMELPFAGVHQLCAPMMNLLERLPGPQSQALGTAFGLRAGDAPDRFLVGLAVLGLLLKGAQDRPLLCLVDDAHWLDRASTQVLAFVARRLSVESVALVFAVPEPSDDQELLGLPELLLGGLADDDARALLDSAIHGRLDDRVRDRLLAEARGNPLSLLELPRRLSPAELAGGFGIPEAVPVESRIEKSLRRRLQSLPAETRRLLLLAAAEPIGDVSLLWRAAQRLGNGACASLPAETAGLIELRTRVRFRHPLVRSAVYRAAALPDRQEVHRALADATNPIVDPDRRAWHRAQASVGPEEAVARALEGSAGSAAGRGGVAAAAAFLERASELTPDPARRGARALAAAEAKFEAAAPDRALQLLAVAELGPLDELQRARSQRLRALVGFARRRGSESPSQLFEAAKLLAPLDARLARETHLEALAAAIYAGRAGDSIREVLAAAQTAPPAQEPPRAIDLLLDGMVIRFTEGYAAGVKPLRRALEAFRHEPQDGQHGMGSWPMAAELWDDEAWHELATRALRAARHEGALTVLPMALTDLANLQVHSGGFAAASALIQEAERVSEATGNAPLRYGAFLAAWRGETDRALELAETSISEARARGEGRAVSLAEYATAVVYNGLGRYRDALDAAERACEHDDLGTFGFALLELVEAGMRSGERERAEVALGQLDERTCAAETDWALGIRARSHALISDGSGAEAFYCEAIERLARTRVHVHLARTYLLYGEWLRRENRRVQARQHLRTAYDMFSSMGAEAFANRARTELLATGEIVRKRSVETRYDLSAQEAQIGRLAADGHTNDEIGGQLFISPRTVEWHLGKVFAKLGIKRRRELRQALSGATVTVLPA